jgi:uncharacterized protein (DUF488 family)
MKAITIWTIGHSTRSEEKFNEILLAHEIEALVDVRTYPGSRRFPHFNKEHLSESLPKIGIEYHHEKRLGGRRRPRKDSKNTGLRNDGFRGYADHMETDEFKEGIAALLEIAKEKRTAFMCAEAVYLRCHRSLISDYLEAQGHRVIHIIDVNRVKEHFYTSAARVTLKTGKLSYPGLF